jgi:UDP-N-acetylglucosamine enolpyruvyl transferase
MAASLLAVGETTIENVPDIADVHIMEELLTRLGCKCSYDREALTVKILVPKVPGHRADYDLVRKMRASINVLGPLVTRVGEVEVALPGGDAIGSRGIDFHIKRYVKDGHIYKEISFEDKGESYHFTEKVQALTLQDFQTMMEEAGIYLLDIFGDYKLKKFHKTESERLIMIFK